VLFLLNLTPRAWIQGWLWPLMLHEKKHGDESSLRQGWKYELRASTVVGVPVETTSLRSPAQFCLVPGEEFDDNELVQGYRGVWGQGGVSSDGTDYAGSNCARATVACVRFRSPPFLLARQSVRRRRHTPSRQVSSRDSGTEIIRTLRDTSSKGPDASVSLK
jgi:hypothetical protein